MWCGWGIIGKKNDNKLDKKQKKRRKLGMGEKIKWSQKKKGHGQPVPREGHVGTKK